MRAEGFSKPIEVFPLGVDTSHFRKFSVPHVKTRLNLDGKFVVGYIGRLLKIKGVSLLIEMLRVLPDEVHLLIIGSGPERPRLQALAADYRLESRIHYLGAVPYAELPQYLNCMDLGILPSKTTKRWKEQFGRALVELMSCEIPVIGSDSGSIPEVIGQAGWLFPEHNVQELVRLVRMLQAHPAQRKAAAKRGRARVIAHYSVEIMAEQFLTMYRQLTSSGVLS
ncbi:glycosyltransferase [candidate division KSB3 bacterium]|uniref:Glycosyltransferase n=1 Tax=candidate division KSB3 bacterium TaxID=2044937 RepID=A0A9D5Q6F2_9BACT|nr:glycosyltransferase [candidate division KSB3 bacterium]MBD3325333.1 glycosyltransferase [candidate division KSB3 bacterium]